MDTTLPSRPDDPKPRWIDRFVARVVELTPGADRQRAWRDAEAIFDTAGGMSPREAAEIWVSSPLPEEGDLGDLEMGGGWPAAATASVPRPREPDEDDDRPTQD